MDDTRSKTRIAPVVKTIEVPWPVDRAFRRFTTEVGEWWPLATHSVGQARTRTCRFEPREGGRLYEVIEGGEEADWGVVTAWEPSRRVAFTWFPGREPDTEQRVEVTFHPADGGGTVVELSHAGWERLGEAGQEMRDGYDSGWDFVLERYRAA